MTHPLKKTPLYEYHIAANAKMTDFGGWNLPIHFGSQIEEHHAVRQNCGLFDVSHMTIWDIRGEDTLAFLRTILANKVDDAAQHTGKALYSCMLNHDAGVIDDLIVYFLNHTHCLMVTNAGTKEQVQNWLNETSSDYHLSIEENSTHAIVAVQGPNAISYCQRLLRTEITQSFEHLARFHGTQFELNGHFQFVGRTGYTGEDGLEFIVDANTAQDIWQTLSNNGVACCGLAARDTLRLESGMALYGNDLDIKHSPLESGLAWTIDKSPERDFIGKKALNKPRYKKINLVLLDKGVLRAHQPVFHQQTQIGEITSGGFSPSLERSIAMARIENTHDLTLGDTVEIEIRNKRLRAQLVANPFVKNGKSNIE